MRLIQKLPSCLHLPLSDSGKHGIQTQSGKSRQDSCETMRKGQNAGTGSKKCTKVLNEKTHSSCWNTKPHKYRTELELTDWYYQKNQHICRRI